MTRIPLSIRRGAVLAIIAVAAISGAAIVLADPSSPVTITDVVSPDPVASGAQITHSITIVNNGGAKINNVVMSDQLNGIGGIGVPPQIQIASSRGSCAQTGTLITCNAGDIEGRGTWTISIRGIVTAANGTVLNNTVSVTGTKSAQNFTTTQTTSTLVSNGGGSNLPELSVNKTGPTSVVASAAMTYTLTVNNTGTQNATDIRVIDTVPAGLTGVTASGTSLFVCGVVDLTVTCDGGAVNQGSNATITINAFAPATIGTITNTAVVDPDNAIAESNELNNTSALVNTQVTDPTATPELGINITDDPTQISGAGPNDPVVPGAGLTYKILVRNNAATRADDVVTVLGTQGLEASSVIVSQIVTNGAVGTHNGCTNVAPQAKCTVRSLNPGGTILMTVSGYVIGSAGSFMIGTATVTGNIKNTGYTTTDTELTTVMPQFDLTITKADSPDPVCAASWPGGPGYPAGVDYPAGNTCQGGLTYTFVVGNSGLQEATGVTVRDPLPAGVIFDHAVDVDAAGFTCAYNVLTNVVTCTGGTIPGQSTKTLKFVMVAPPSVGQITNTVTVDPNNAIFEADESNNTFAQTTQVATGIDLTVAKHSNHEADFVATRGTLTYTITVSNLGTQDSTNIHVRDTLPADTLFRDAVADPAHGFSCSHSGGVVDCVGGRIEGTKTQNYPNPPGTNVDEATITIRLFATAYEQPAMHNEVRVDPLNQIAEVNENNNLAIQNTQVKSGGTTNDAFNELTISKVQLSPDPLNTARNAVVTYEIKVGNDGTDPVVGVKVRDTLPAGARYIEAIGTNSFLCQQQLIGFVDCVGGQIAANTPTAAGATITIKAFAPDTPGTYTNQVEADPDHTIAEGNEFNNNASAQTVVKNGGAGSFHELSVTKTQTSPDKTNTARNAIVTYSIVVTNTGTDAVNGVVVRDKLPAGARYIQATGNNQFLCSEENTGIVDCVNGQVAGGGGTSTITLTMFAPDTPATYINQVNVDPDNAIPEGDEFNNQATEQTVVANGGEGAFNELTIVKTGPATAAPRGPISYTLAVSNTGSNAAQNVTVRDVLPAGTEFVSAADAAPGAGAFLCSHNSGIVNCTGGTLNPGAPRNISIKVKAPNAQLTITNQAFIDPDNDIPEGDETNNASTADTAILSNMNLKLTKSGPTESSQGQTGKYTVTVTNVAGGAGGETAFDVTMRDTLPVGLIPLSVENNGNFLCTVAENPINEVVCLGDLESGEGKKVTFTIDVFMTGEGSRKLDNEACIDTENLYEEFLPEGESDNCWTATSSTVPPAKKSPNLFVSKSASTSSVTPGQALTYTILVQNNGNAKAMGPLTLTDNLPSAVTLQNANGTNGWTCSESAGDVVCHEPPDPLGGDGLEPGASATITIDVTVNNNATLSFTNSVSIGTGQGDPADPEVEDEKAEHLSDNTASMTTSVGGSGTELVLGSIIDTPDPVNRSKQLKWTIVALNSGTLTADDAIVRITLPGGVSVIGAEGTNGFNCPAPVSGVINCTGDLAGSGDTTITVTAVVQPGAPDDLILTAKIDPDDAITEGDETDNEQSEVTTVSGDTCTSSPCIDLVAALLHAQPDPVSAGGNITFHYTFVNIGDTTTALFPHGVLLFADVAGAHTSFVREISNPAITCVDVGSPGASILSDCSGELGPGEGVTITITVNGVSGATITATGTADFAMGIPEFIEGFFPGGPTGNNQLVKTVTINP